MRLVPFGNAHLDDSATGASCQHGEVECEGNVYELCAMRMAYYRFEDYSPFVKCLESALGEQVSEYNPSPSSDAKGMAHACLPNLKAENATAPALDRCFAEEGKALNTWAGNMTAFEKQSSPFNKVPSFFLGSFDACKEDDGAFSQVTAYSQTPEGVREAICAQYKALGGGGVEACKGL